MKCLLSLMRSLQLSLVTVVALVFSRIVALFRSVLRTVSFSNRKKLLKVFCLSLLVFIQLLNFSVSIFAEDSMDFGSNLKYAWFGRQSNMSPNYATCIASNTLQPDFTSYPEDNYLALSFPFDITNYSEYYTVSFVFTGSAVTNISSSSSFITTNAYYLGNPDYIRTKTSGGYSLYLDPSSNTTMPIKLSSVEAIQFYREYPSSNTEIVQFTIRGRYLAEYLSNEVQHSSSRGVVFRLNESYIQSHSKVVVLTAIQGHYDIAEREETLAVLKEISASTENIVDSIESGSNVIVGELGEINDILSQDGSFDDGGLESGVNSHNQAQDAVNNKVTDILTSGVTINGVTYVISNPSGNLFEGVMAAYGEDLSNFNLNAPNAGTYFRHVVDSWISIFGILIFMSLMIGVAGALLGRS